MVSIKDIAKACGVSTATVSKALNNRDDIGKATKNKIRKIAEEMGYIATASARALKTNRTYNIGMLFEDTMLSGLSHEFFSHILEGFRGEAEKRGYDITFINHNIAGDRTTYLRHSTYHNFDGVGIICADFESSEVAELVESDIPVVTIDMAFPDRPSVSSDNLKGVYQLVKYASSKGHRRIAYIHGEMTDVTKDRLSSFYRAMREFDIPVRPEYIRMSRYHDTDSCRKLTRELLELEERPTCIIFPDDYSYLGGQEAINEKGLSVPDDISVIGYDGITLSRIIGLTTYAQDAEGLGKKAAEKLILTIEDKATGVERLEIPGHLIEGRTVKALG